jgi:hypothetical protein
LLYFLFNQSVKRFFFWFGSIEGWFRSHTI